MNARPFYAPQRTPLPVCLHHYYTAPLSVALQHISVFSISSQLGPIMLPSYILDAVLDKEIEEDEPEKMESLPFFVKGPCSSACSKFDVDGDEMQKENEESEEDEEEKMKLLPFYVDGRCSSACSNFDVDESKSNQWTRSSETRAQFGGCLARAKGYCNVHSGLSSPILPITSPNFSYPPALVSPSLHQSTSRQWMLPFSLVTGLVTSRRCSVIFSLPSPVSGL
ncbi:hypothetical protein V2J09_008472 [Rumex salicifolius]